MLSSLLFSSELSLSTKLTGSAICSSPGCSPASAVTNVPGSSQRHNSAVGAPSSIMT